MTGNKRWCMNSFLLHVREGILCESEQRSYWTSVYQDPLCPRPQCRLGRRPQGWPASALQEHEAASAGSQTVAA